MGFVARWLVPGDSPGSYQAREDEPERGERTWGHSSPIRGGSAPE
jgi:hypothetical protein